MGRDIRAIRQFRSMKQETCAPTRALHNKKYQKWKRKKEKIT
jgi:hypothetical protein